MSSSDKELERNRDRSHIWRPARHDEYAYLEVQDELANASTATLSAIMQYSDVLDATADEMVTLNGQDFGLQKKGDINMPIAEIKKRVYKGMQLPNSVVLSHDVASGQWKVSPEWKKSGPLSSVDRRYMFRKNMERQAAKTGRAEFNPRDILPEDLRFRQVEQEMIPQRDALAVVMVDTALGAEENFFAKQLSIWAVGTHGFLREIYGNNLNVRYIAHGQEIKESTEQEVFMLFEEKKKAPYSQLYSNIFRKLIYDTELPDELNLYLFHLTDGTNDAEDVTDMNDEIEYLNEIATATTYVEISMDKKRNTSGTVFRVCNKNPKMKTIPANHKSDLLPVLQQTFKRRT